MGGTPVSESFWIVIGMSIAYIASSMGLVFAWIHYRKRKMTKSPSPEDEGRPG